MAYQYKPSCLELLQSVFADLGASLRCGDIFLIPETCVSGIYCAIVQFSVELSQFVRKNYPNTIYFEQKTFLYPFCISIECTRIGPDIRYVKWYT